MTLLYQLLCNSVQTKPRHEVCKGLVDISIYDISIASPFHRNRLQSLHSTLNTRYQNKLVDYRSVFSNFHLIMMSPTGTHHHQTIAIFKSLRLEVSTLHHIAETAHLHNSSKPRARAYRAIYDAAKTPRTDVGHSLSPLPSLPAFVLRPTLASLPLLL